MRNQEITQLLIPTYGSEYITIDFTGHIVSESGLGVPPLHYITQRGVVQDGETVLGKRLDPRPMQLVVSRELYERVDFWARRAYLQDMFSINRNFELDGTVVPCIYRKVLLTGEVKWRSDLVTEAGEAEVSSVTSEFSNWGVREGSVINILTGADADEYTVVDVVNENILTLDTNMSADATGIEFSIRTGIVTRDIYVLLDRGLTFDDKRVEWTTSYTELLRFYAPDPLWRNPLQQRLTNILEEDANLIFYRTPDWEDRLVFPIWFAGTDVYRETDLVYVGTWPSRPIIVVTGPFTYFEVTNVSTGDTIAMLYSASSGETVTVNLDTLRAYSSTGADLTNKITEDSDEISFGLYPDPTVQGGVNTMQIYLTGGTVDVSTVLITWYAKYVSL